MTTKNWYKLTSKRTGAIWRTKLTSSEAKKNWYKLTSKRTGAIWRRKLTSSEAKSYKRGNLALSVKKYANTKKHSTRKSSLNLFRPL